MDLDGNTEGVSYQLVLVEILTEDGLSGIGEVGLTYGDGASGAVRLVHELARNHVIGSDSRNISDIWERIYRNSFWVQGGVPSIDGALSALDLSLWEIKGKYFNVPVYELLGGAVRKLRFGHHGANQPARDTQTGKVWIASENHGFALEFEALDSLGDVEVTHVNLNDGTVEGLRHRKYPAFSVQYHPEASPGPHDAAHLFDRFRQLIEEHRAAA